MQINDVYKDCNGNLVTVTEIGSYMVRFDKDDDSKTLLIEKFLELCSPWKDYVEVRRKLAESPIEYLLAAYDECFGEYMVYDTIPKINLTGKYWRRERGESKTIHNLPAPQDWTKSLVKRIDDFQDLIDWDALPDEAVCIACNSDNQWFWSNTKEIIPNYCGFILTDIDNREAKSKFNFRHFKCNLIPLDWRDSLTMRPVELTTDNEMKITPEEGCKILRENFEIANLRIKNKTFKTMLNDDTAMGELAGYLANKYGYGLTNVVEAIFEIRAKFDIGTVDAKPKPTDEQLLLTKLLDLTKNKIYQMVIISLVSM